jgi:type II restriction/modification system DNA methylase subunit YeeA
MTPHEFIRKWKPVALTEPASAHSHFRDLCDLLGHDDPIKADPTGEWFTFEKGVTKTGGGEGFADVWKRNHFAWEYKKKKRDLNAALDQLVRYAAALENPPLQVACDTDRFLIRTAWTNAVPKTYELALDDLADPLKLDTLRSVFFDPEKLRPKETRAAITKEAADKFSTIALRLQGRGTPEQVAHFVNQLVFCFFANSVKLLPEGFFPKLLRRAAENATGAKGYFDALFAAMEGGGEFDLTPILHFNGGLFDGRRALPLDSGDIDLLQAAASMDWSQIDPTIFGTLFERFLDPGKRGQIGAHYTDPEKIMMIIEPVILRPLRLEWAAAKAEIEGLLTGTARAPTRAKTGRRMAPKEAAEEARSRFLERLRKVTILDPACGSGNFLYLALQGVKDIELKANLECEALGLSPRVPIVDPEIVRGIEINPLAAELARTTIWIGDIQWRIRNGIHARPKPILRKLDSIECRDALITRAPAEEPNTQSSSLGLTRESTSSGGKAKKDVDGRDKPGHDEAEVKYVEAEWPTAEFIVGNPPFLGSKEFLEKLGEDYSCHLRDVYVGEVSARADLVAYWFYKAARQLHENQVMSFGFVATNKIRRGANQELIKQIVTRSSIFDAWSDLGWIIDGADVRVSLVCITSLHITPNLNGLSVPYIGPELNSGIAQSIRPIHLRENADCAFVGGQKDGPFEIPGTVARALMSLPSNPNGRKNCEVVRPWLNGRDLAGRSTDTWIIDFGELSLKEAALFEAPFQHVQENVLPHRTSNRDKHRRTVWWLHGRPASKAKRAIERLSCVILTPLTSKHRWFVFSNKIAFPDNSVVVIAKDDYSTFGILSSAYHRAWAIRAGNFLGVGNDPRYTPTTTFETFPFPEGLTPHIPAKDYADDPRAQAIAKAASRLDELRNNWLNPPDLVRIEPEVVPGYPDRILPKDTVAAVKLRERTLTKLYNERPQWLVDAHRDLDAAVAAAYGWPADIPEEDALAKLLALNLARAGTSEPVKDSVEEQATEASEVLGRETFGKISEVEGMPLTDDMKEAFADFDAQGLPHEERRRAIIGRFKRAAE